MPIPRTFLRPTTVVLGLLLGAVGPVASPAGAQTAEGGSWVGAGPASAAAAEVDSLIASGDAAASLARAEAALRERPDEYELHWRAARAATAVAVLQQGMNARRDSLYRVGIAHAQAAVDLRPDGLDGLYWRMAAKGRLSLDVDATTQADLGEQVEAEALAILALDSLHAGAHNALGRLNLEVMALPRWKRAAGRLLLGGALDRTSWELAEAHLLRAVQLEPANALFLRDLAALHYHRNRPAVARVLFERLAGYHGLLPWDEVFRDEALRMLDELDGEAR